MDTPQCRESWQFPEPISMEAYSMPRGFLQCTPVYILKPFFRLHLAQVFGVSKGGIASAAESLGLERRRKRGTWVCWEKCSCPPMVQKLSQIVAAPVCGVCGNSYRLLVSDCFPPRGLFCRRLDSNGIGFKLRVSLLDLTGGGWPRSYPNWPFRGECSWSRQGSAAQKESRLNGA